MDLKPGIKTSEFWITIITQVLSMLVFFGLITPAEQSQLNEGVAQLASGIAIIVTPIAYIISRAIAKFKK